MADAVVVSMEEDMKGIDRHHVNGKKNRIRVSNNKKPLFFYLNLAKRYIKQHNDVDLSALGMAIPTLVTICEILKASGVAVEKKVLISTVNGKDEAKGRVIQKAKLEIVLVKNDKPPSPKNSVETESQEEECCDQTTPVAGESEENGILEKPKDDAGAGNAENE